MSMFPITRHSFPGMLVSLAFCLATYTANAARVEFAGDTAIDIDPAGDRVAIEIAELRNASATEGTGRLFLSLRHTQCDAPSSPGFHALEVEYAMDETARPGLYPLDRAVTGGDSSLAPQASWSAIEITADYNPPPAGTYRRHLLVYELDVSETEEGVLKLVGAATVPRRHVQPGREEIDSCFTAMPLDANTSHEGRIGLLDNGDFYCIRSYSRGVLQVETTGSLDTVGELLDSTGRVLNRDTDGGEAGNFRIERQIDSRRYCLHVTAAGDGFGDYTLRTTHTPATTGAGRDRDDDTVSRATPLRLGEAVTDAIDAPDDIDWWSLQAPSTGRFAIEWSGKAATYRTLFNDFIETLDDDEAARERDRFRLDDDAEVQAGTYYLRVEGSSTAGPGPYSLRAVHLPEDASGLPDLVAEFRDTGIPQLAPGEPFVFNTTVENRGNGASEPTVVRLYRSANRVISLADEVELTEQFDALDALAADNRFLRFGGASAEGDYQVGACVRPIEGETDTDNNCTAAVRVKVRQTPENAPAEPIERLHPLPLVLAASASGREGFVRIINRSDEAGMLEVHAVDDAGIRFGPVEIGVEAQAAVHFSARDLEAGNPEKGIVAGIGPGQGDWRLEVQTALDIVPLAYVRRADGFLTAMHDTADTLEDGRYYIPFFNPARNTRQVSRLRLVNPGTEAAEVTIDGIDDRGAPPLEGSVRLLLPAGEARTVSADDLESGADGLQGRFGAGSGKWRLFLSATAPLTVSNLLASPAGYLANLSSRGRQRSLPLVLPASAGERTGLVRIVNWSDTPGEARIRGIDATGRRTDAATLQLDAAAATQFNSADLERGNESKGLAGGIGPGEGDWRLELESSLDPEALAYVRTADGFVTGIHGQAADVLGIVEAPFLNPASNTRQQSRLRLSNPGATETVVTFTGRDDNGAAPPYGTVRLTLPPGESRTVTAIQLEVGADGLRGRFGDGAGKWRVSVASEQPIEVMSLLESPTGNLTNLSSGGAPQAGPESEQAVASDGV